jgi:hypothetical protein
LQTEAEKRSMPQAGRLPERIKAVFLTTVNSMNMSDQVTSESISKFVKNNDITLVPTQSKLCIPIIQRMCRKMLIGIKFDDIKICDNLIIDGHHRYLSSLLVNREWNSVPSEKTSATEPVKWADVEFDESDWDTESKILYLNEQDAKYNKVDIEVLKQITALKK